MERLTLGRFNELADRDGFIVVYPDAVERNWNDGRGIASYRAQRDNIDDVGYISALIDRFVAERNVDPERVYVTGMSNGALMSYRFACELSQKIAAIAPVCGLMIGNYTDYDQPVQPISVLMINGEDDPLVPWDGGAVHFGDRELGRVTSVADTLSFWVDHNNRTSPTSRVWEPDRSPDDGTRVYHEAYANGTDGTEVILYGVQGGGHTWPGGSQYLPESTIGKTSHDINACDVIWSFFKNHSRTVGASQSPPDVTVHAKTGSWVDWSYCPLVAGLPWRYTLVRDVSA